MPKEASSGGLLEGAGFKCIHDGFFTRDVEEWNKHAGKKEGDSTHNVEDGAAPCAICKEEVEFQGLPYCPFDQLGNKPVIVFCEDCARSIKSAKLMRKAVKQPAAAGTTKK